MATGKCTEAMSGKKMSTKETWLQSPVTDVENLFSENVKAKNIEK